MEPEQKSAYGEVKMGLARQMNLAKDSNKVKRRRAFQRISREVEELLEKLEDDEKTWKPVLSKLFFETLATTLEAGLKDSSETPRETVANLLISIIPHLNFLEGKSSAGVFKGFINSIHVQIGTFPMKEPSEEVRLLQLQVCIILTNIAEKAGELVVNSIENLVSICEACAKDNFPKVKVEIVELISGIAKIALSVKSPYLTAEKKIEYTSRLCKAILPNLKHQRFRVRMATLRAISNILTQREKTEDWFRDALPSISKATLDRTAAVRLEFTKLTGNWLETLEIDKSIRNKLLLLLLASLGDTDEQTKKEGIEALKRLSRGEEEGKTKPITSEQKQQWIECKIPSAFDEIPGIETRAIIVKHVSDLVTPALSQLTSWTDSERFRAVKVLLALIYLAQESIALHAGVILQTISPNLNDLEQPIIAEFKSTLHAIGCLLPIDSWKGRVNKALTKTGEGGHTNWLIMLDCLIESAPPSSLYSYIPFFSDLLCQDILCFSSDFPTRYFTLKALRTLLIQRLSSKKDPMEDKLVLKIFWALIKAHTAASSQQEYVLAEKVMLILQENAGIKEYEKKSTSRSDIPPSVGIYSQYFLKALKNLLKTSVDSKKIRWEADTIESRLLVTLFRRSQYIIHEYLDDVVPLMVEGCGNADNAPKTRIHMLSVLLQLVTNSDTKQWSKYGPTLVKGILLPNMVWRNTSVSQTIRHVATQILESILSASLDFPSASLDFSEIRRIMANEIATLETCLDDEAKRIRVLMCKIFTIFLTKTSSKHPLDELAMNKLYPKLVDRLDDSDDEVRIGICDAIAAIVASFPPGFDSSGVAFRYIVKHALIHLDDQKQAVQKAVYGLLATIGSHNPKIFSEIVNNARTKHRDPHLCEMLLKKINN